MEIYEYEEFDYTISASDIDGDSLSVVAAAAISAGLDPAIFMIPAAMAASCAYMLPVATAPNAI